MSFPDVPLHTLDVWGDFACFSRPELSVERWSYPVPTPSAARGILDAIYCHPPEFRWEVVRIEVLRPPRYIALRRNEVKEKVSTAAVLGWMEGRSEPAPLLADADKAETGSDERGRTQRQTMALCDVRYRLTARVRPWPRFERAQKSFDEQFDRRVKAGKCFQQPYFGCREFVAFFGEPDAAIAPFRFDQDLGLMLYDVFDLGRGNGSNAAPFISLFRAVVAGGVLDVPPFDDTRVLKPRP
jgi:CRISPR-associated protein Cas5d